MGVTLWQVVFDMEDWEATNDNDDPMMADQAYCGALFERQVPNLWGTLRYLNSARRHSGHLNQLHGAHRRGWAPVSSPP
jgi:hypothetical protein